MPQLAGVSATGSVGAVHVRTRASFGITHLLSAAYLSKCVGEIERAHAGDEFGPFWEDIQALAVATVLSAFAALEAYANEVFIDHRLYYPEQTPAFMEKLWETYERKDVLDKVEFALLLKGIQVDRGSNCWVQVKALKSLRDALTHFKAEWSDEGREHSKLSKQLQHKAVMSQFPKNVDLFPMGWVSHGTTVWAVKSAAAFLVEFERLLPPPYAKLQNFMERLADL
jgi:hypothetical protein